MRIALISMSALLALTTVATATTPPCGSKVSTGEAKWTTCVPDEFHAPSAPKPISGGGLKIRK